MSNLFGMYSTTTRAMQAQSYMISTASHNLANAETEGFSRQRVQLSAADPVTYKGIGQLGNGVNVDLIKRLRDGFLDVQIRYETSILNKYTSAQSALDQVEAIFKEPSESGLMTVMSSMWNSWTELASKPEGTTQRTLVAQRADEMATMMNHMYEQLETLNKNTVSEIEGDVYDANALLSEIQDTCSQIYKAKIQGLEPNDLLDRRDLLLEKLSAIVNINVQEDQFGRVRITEADSGEKYELLNYSKDTPPEYYMSVIREATYDSGQWTLTVTNGGDISDVISPIILQGNEDDFKAGDVLMCHTGSATADSVDFELTPYRPELGSISGKQMAIEKSEGYMMDLDRIAYTMASAINTVHGLDGGTTFFTVKDPNGEPAEFPDSQAESFKGAAKNIKVNDDIMADVSLINAGLAGSEAGDSRLAKAIADLQDVKFNMFDMVAFHDQLDTFITNSASGELKIDSYTGGSTTSGYYQDLIGKIGIDSASSQRNITNQESLLMQLNAKRDSVSAVSIDEEVANLMQYLTAYQANARVINTITTMLDTLINLAG